MLLDLNLPRKDGREVLAESQGRPGPPPDPGGRADDVLRRRRTSLRLYQLHANAYVTKPVDFERFIEVVHQIDEFFADLVTLPPREPPPPDPE